MTIEQLSKKAERIKEKYEDLNRINGKKPWTVTEYANGLMGDVGDLIKLILQKKTSRVKKSKDLNKKIRHELADCLWSIIVIAQEMDVDLEKEFLINIEYLQQKLSEEVENL